MPTTMIVRLRPFNKRKAQLRKSYTYRGKTYHQASWYKVDASTAAYLATVRSQTNDEAAPLSFDVCETKEQAEAIEEAERLERIRQTAPDDDGILSIKDLSMSSEQLVSSEADQGEEMVEPETVSIPGAPAKRRSPKRTARRRAK